MWQYFQSCIVSSSQTSFKENRKKKSRIVLYTDKQQLTAYGLNKIVYWRILTKVKSVDHFISEHLKFIRRQIQWNCLFFVEENQLEKPKEKERKKEKQRQKSLITLSGTRKLLIWRNVIVSSIGCIDKVFE